MCIYETVKLVAAAAAVDGRAGRVV